MLPYNVSSLTAPYQTQEALAHSYDLPVGENLYAALSHLRDCSIERTIWADAVCINQRDPKEKGKQVQSMAKIYAKASGVIVWLGEATPDSGQALEDIRIAAEQRTKLSRIWVLQEVAAARHVFIKCGPTEIDGYAFCAGLGALNLSYEAHPDLRPLIRSVAYLIRGAAFRPRCATSRPGRFSLDICSLGELVDMYHTHKATDRRDKVYALIGMSSDDPSIAGLSANYEISWGQLFLQLVNFFFSERVSVDTWDDKEMAVIRGKGCVLGEVSSVDRDIDREDRQHVGITWKNVSGYGGANSRWTLQASAKSVQAMQRLLGRGNDCSPPPDDLQAASGDTKAELLRLTTTFPHNFLLVWDWSMYSDESQGRENYEHFMGAPVSEYPKTELEDRLDKVIRLRDTGVVLQDIGRYDEAEGTLRKALEIFESALTSIDCLEPACSGHGRCRKGDIERLEGILGLLIKDKGIWMPLWLAAENGHEAIVKLLLSTGKVNLNVEESVYGQTLLSLAAQNRHAAIVKLLLDTGRVNPDAKDRTYGGTPLWWATKNGYEAIVDLLLGTGKVDPDAKDRVYGQTPLLLAAQKGHAAIVKLLLDTGKVDPDAKEGDYGRTPLSLAELKGRETILKLLRRHK
ncbi:hypothetical protein NCS56_01310400 [Fusarium sp. Ph1]|nr:hypothetical protein NCS56_01310400 [Fusarium sp. Ph1]